jgi:hypothetical protein
LFNKQNKLRDVLKDLLRKKTLETMEQNKPIFTSVELHSQGTTAKAKEQFFSTRQARGNQNTTSSMGTENVVLPDAAFL